MIKIDCKQRKRTYYVHAANMLQFKERENLEKIPETCFLANFGSFYGLVYLFNCIPTPNRLFKAKI